MRTQPTVTFKAEAKLPHGGRQYIARILGRDSKYLFRREFLGTKSGTRREYSSLTTDEPGLYETCNVNRKGDKDKTFYVVLVWENNVRRGVVTEEEAIVIARGLDAATAIEELVVVHLADEGGTLSNGLPKIRIDAR
jgi:hypothetical protein